MVCVWPFTVSRVSVRGAEGAPAGAAGVRAAVCALALGAAVTTASAVPVPLMNRRREILRFMMTPESRDTGTQRPQRPQSSLGFPDGSGFHEQCCLCVLCGLCVPRRGKPRLL